MYFGLRPSPSSTISSHAVVEYRITNVHEEIANKEAGNPKSKFNLLKLALKIE